MTGNITKDIDTVADITIFTVTGDVSPHQIKDAINDFYEGPVTKYVLWDLSKFDPDRISSADVESIAQIPRGHSARRSNGKTAIIAPEDVPFGLSRMYELLTELSLLPFDTQSFRSIEKARQWLLERE